MGSDYTPPIGTEIPFVFTDKGYTSPNSTSMLFDFAQAQKFGSLKAAVNVMQPYWHTTHTYAKECPKYVIGYGSGGVQIIKGRCLFGGIRDLQGIITVQSIANDVGDLASSIRGFVTTHLPGVIESHSPENLNAALKVRFSGNRYLPAYIKTIYQEDFPAVLEGTHNPEDLKSYLNVRQRETKSLNAFVHSWLQSDISAFIRAKIAHNLPASVYPIPPGDLSAYLKVFSQDNLTATTYGWGSSDLGASVVKIYEHLLPAAIYGRDDMYGDLRARLKGMGTSVPYDLPASIRSFHYSNLPATLRATYLSSIVAHLNPVQPKDIVACIHAWHKSDLQGILNVEAYPWNLTAEIKSVGRWALLKASILPKTAVAIYRDLKASVHMWRVRNLTSNITGTNALFLGASLIPLGYSGDLHASINPKMIRLTTVIDIPTLNHRNLSAIINYPCFKTNMSNLSSYIYGTMKGDLYAYIRPIRYNYKPALLGAKVGYADSILEVDKLKLSIIVYPSEITSEDKLRLQFNVFNSGGFLGAYIRGTLRYKQLSAEIKAEQLPKFKFPTPIKNREVVVHKNYNGVFEQFEYVEMSFKSVVEDYYYSSAGNYAWKDDKFSKWALDVRSFLPTNTSLRLKRRLHRATLLYDLRKFSTVDEAVKFAIAYVTEYPQGNLSASIWNRGRYDSLRGVINPRYVKTAITGLGAEINPQGTTVVLGFDSEISKI